MNQVYRYSCLATQKGVLFKKSLPFMIESAVKCFEQNESPPGHQECIDNFYQQLIKAE